MSGNKFIESLRLPVFFVLLLWAIHLIQYFTGMDLGTLGVFPRKIFGLRGIIFSPLIHGSFGHLISNTPPLFFMSLVILFFYRRVALKSMAMIYFLSGLALWIFGRQVFHIGASGVIYGLVAFVFWNGVFRRNVKSIALALIVVFYYGSMIWGVLPGQKGVSWEGHLTGALIGLFTSYWFKEFLEKDEEKKLASWEKNPELEEEKPFFDGDVFEKTRKEREKDENNFGDWFSTRT